MSRVEFRFLQYIVSPVTDERVTLGLLHWDREKLRFAFSVARLPASHAAHRKPLERYLKALARKAARDPGKMYGLEHAFTVQQGRGGSMLWTPVRVGRTSDAASHFAELRELAGVQETEGAKRAKGARVLKAGLEQMGHQLAREAPDAIAVRRRVSKGGTGYVSPLSWKNGRWNHTVPMSYARATPEAMLEETRWAVGLIRVDFPEADKAVILALLPRGRRLMREAVEQTAIIVREATSDRVDVITTKTSERDKTLRQLRARIRDEINHAAE